MDRLLERGKISGSHVSLFFKSCPNPTLPAGDPLSLVQDFIIPDTQLWNWSLLEKTFDRSSVEQITQIHLPSPNIADRAIWVPNYSGTFLAKSAYHQILSDRTVNSGDIPPIDWSKLWHLNMHDRLKVFLWKNCSGYLTYPRQSCPLPS